MFNLRKLVRAVCLISILASLQACIVLVPFIESDFVAKTNNNSQDSCAYAKLESNVMYFQPAKFPPQNVQQARVRAMPTTKNIKRKSVRKASVRKARVSISDKVLLLVSQLTAESDVTRTHAASDLGFIGPQARKAVPALSQALAKDPSKWVRRAAAKSLGKIGAKEGIVALQLALKDRNEWVVHSAQNALKRLQVSHAKSA